MKYFKRGSWSILY